MVISCLLDDKRSLLSQTCVWQNHTHKYTSFFRITTFVGALVPCTIANDTKIFAQMKALEGRQKPLPFNLLGNVNKDAT